MKNKNTIPDHIIIAGIGGESHAIRLIIGFYRGYITSLATTYFYDKYGNSRPIVDYDLCDELEIELITGILKFELAE